MFEKGTLTVATDRPAYPPWFKGRPKSYSGFEGEIAREIADRLGLPIKWVVEPFARSFAPGEKDYDFDINQVTITSEREQEVDFSDPYFENNQGVLVLEGSRFAEASSVTELSRAVLGAQKRSTALRFITAVIKPRPKVQQFNTTDDAKTALKQGEIDALVTDVVTAVYLRDFEISGSLVVGQYPEPEYFGMVFEEGNALVPCVNRVLQEMKDDGTLVRLEEKFLESYLSVPPLD
ncbi:MAG: ABC transporter substrate-binding protein [Actinomycetota bacterium]|nr:ABC transporter substrate-binding protein [Actinomycetota bacterium]